MHILLIGSGAREQAIAWKLLSSPRLQQLSIAPGNGGTMALQAHFGAAKVKNVALAEHATQSIIDYAKQHAVDYVIIGPEAPLAAGLADALKSSGIPVFGPTASAAQIESSKAFAKAFMQRHHIPTARYAVFKEAAEALAHIRQISYPIVIKASGLAAGKGVVLPDSMAEAEQAIQQLQQLGQASAEIIVEERLVGEEVSLLGFSDGYFIQAMPPARDHKRLLDGDKGPNTGGMGAYAPAPICSAEQVAELIRTILQPAIDGLRAEGMPFVGVLYAGLMLTEAGPKVLEFNCRFGDPETQVLMLLLETDLIDIVEACVQGNLANLTIRWRDASAACVVVAAAGYPVNPRKGDKITGLNSLPENVQVFHAATTYQENNAWQTAGGRVLSLCALGNDLEGSLQSIYQALTQINFPGMQYRKDIGQSGLKAQDQADHYAAAGVNIAAGQQTVEMISQAVRSTYGPEVIAGIGAFGGMFHAGSLQQMQEPILVASTDGVGTKVHLAVQAGRLRSLGHDIVNHSVNDILVQGAKPLFFMDYLAASRLEPENLAQIVAGMAEACRDAGCALLGGETAEMPGVYAPGMLDIAGTIVGVVERSAALPKTNLQAGDILLGIASSGPHTNGYSLIRKLFADVPLDTYYGELNSSLADALLAPHRSYLRVLQPLLRHTKQPIKALAHITGGGFTENIPRILPNTISALLDNNSWPIPPLFKLIKQQGQVSTSEMYRVFNMGIGMVLALAPENLTEVQQALGEPSWVIGKLIEGQQEVIWQMPLD